MAAFDASHFPLAERFNDEQCVRHGGVSGAERVSRWHCGLAASRNGAPGPASALATGINELFDRLGADDIARVHGRHQRMTLAAGKHVFRQGDAADAVYLVVRGSISIVAPRSDGLPGPRFASLSPGTLFGEAAVLDGGGRSADAVADTETELLRPDQAALIALAQAHPGLGIRLYRNMGVCPARRLRIASTAWSAAAD